jgi:non-haem Fe2+, alpha-ketoglutarate-dependent halogenase
MSAGKRLDAEAVARFERDGVLFPVRALPTDEVATHLRALEAIENARAGRLPPSLNAKPHLLITWLWQLVHDPRIVDAVEDLLGPDLLCFGTSFISKSGHDARHVSWHQDATHWGLSQPHAVTAWLAFTPSLRSNGCVRAVPGTHARQLAHDHPVDPDNLLGRRERVQLDIDEAAVVDVELQPGEMSLHHPLLVHGSEPNRSGARRTGFALRYLPGDIRQADGKKGSATWVRGRDFGHFEWEHAPEADFHPTARARHTQALRRGLEVIFAGARDEG